MSKEEIDIFANTNAAPQNGEFFKFAEIGNGVQGTYVDKREGVDGFHNNQIIYVLKDKDGKLWNAAFRATSVVVHERMKNVRLGTIVGFRYDSDGTVKRGANAGTSFKIINPYFDAKTVDKEWLADHPNAQVDSISIPEVRRGDEEGDEGPMHVETTSKEPAISESSLEAIRNLAKAKGLIESGFSTEEGDTAVEEFTGLELTEDNLAKIIIALTTYKA
jgi:hypothetical protein